MIHQEGSRGKSREGSTREGEVAASHKRHYGNFGARAETADVTTASMLWPAAAALGCRGSVKGWGAPASVTGHGDPRQGIQRGRGGKPGLLGSSVWVGV